MPNNWTPQQRATMMKALREIEKVAAKAPLDSWDWYALRCAYVMVDAVWRQDRVGLAQAHRFSQKALDAIGDPTTLEGAAAILYGYIPSTKREA